MDFETLYIFNRSVCLKEGLNKAQRCRERNGLTAEGAIYRCRATLNNGTSRTNVGQQYTLTCRMYECRRLTDTIFSKYSQHDSRPMVINIIVYMAESVRKWKWKQKQMFIIWHCNSKVDINETNVKTGERDLRVCLPSLLLGNLCLLNNFGKYRRTSENLRKIIGEKRANFDWRIPKLDTQVFHECLKNIWTVWQKIGLQYFASYPLEYDNSEIARRICAANNGRVWPVEAVLHDFNIYLVIKEHLITSKPWLDGCLRWGSMYN